jgi:sugar phosphate isomerase/epimerase
MVHNFKPDWRAGNVRLCVEKAAKAGARGVQVLTTRGPMSAEEMTGEKRREFLDMVKSYGLEISATCVDFGKGFADPLLNPELIERSKRGLELALDLGTKVATTHIGAVPGNPSHDRYKIMQEACFELASFADSIGACFAVETGPEKADVLKRFLDSLGSKGVSANLDPANLIMESREDPVRAVYVLRDYIVHTHAKDGKNFRAQTGAAGGPDENGPACKEFPLGQGDVQWTEYLRALEEIGYRGYLTIEREVGTDPEADIRMAVDFLTKITG